MPQRSERASRMVKWPIKIEAHRGKGSKGLTGHRSEQFKLKFFSYVSMVVNILSNFQNYVTTVDCR